MIREVLPDYGAGFLAACLDAAGQDSERVLHQLLEGSLPPELARLDPHMPLAPPAASRGGRACDAGNPRELYLHGPVLKRCGMQVSELCLSPLSVWHLKQPACFVSSMCSCASEHKTVVVLPEVTWRNTAGTENGAALSSSGSAHTRAPQSAATRLQPQAPVHRVNNSTMAACKLSSHAAAYCPG